MSNYQDTLAWMFNKLPMYQRIGEKAYKPNLKKMSSFVNYLDSPHSKFPSIHVAGTNGKGSTSHIISSILQEEGYSVGLYTSPHLKDFSERIKIQGKPIDSSFVVSFINTHKDYLEKNSLSFFEMTVGLAFTYFATKKVDIAIIEVGLGGRLDATNVIHPLLSVITNIGLDHTEFLGTTFEEIAKEKAGIIKKDTPVVIGETKESTRNVFLEIAKEKNAPIVFAKQMETSNFPMDLKGKYQLINQKTALSVFQNLKDFSVKKNSIKDGLNNVIKNTGLEGRWQKLKKKPLVIADVAHNAEGFTHSVNQFKTIEHKQLHLVLGFVKGKSLEPIFELLPKTAHYYFCSPQINRGLPVTELERIAEEFFLSYRSFSSTKNAYDSALKNAQISDFVYVGGSNFVVAEII